MGRVEHIFVAQARGEPMVAVARGISLNAFCGKRFSVGGVELEGLELCEPCALFAKRTHPDVVRFFLHKGGLRARILRGGMLSVGDSVGSCIET